ncbi:uncharacterized protein K02A2.6-like [Ornithodoros turicata]|uniref:uncharacterized protein K02A2.6-like n=1 Tax=Ornithodoros turicata TaxID=34597 RepID=UPI003138DA30
MATLGHIEEFDPSSPERWDAYESRLTFYLEANGITDPARKRAVFLSVCGAATFDLVQSLLAPATPETKSFSQILATLKEHFAPQPSEIVCRNAFYRRNQGAGESVALFIAELRRLAQKCNFPNLEEMLRDRLVCGLVDENLQNRLFAKKKLTFKVAQEEALAAEAAARSTREVRTAEAAATADINALHRQQQERANGHQSSARETGNQGKKTKPCDGCGGAHAREFCRFRDAQCHYCKKIGHIERVCRLKQRSSANATTDKPVGRKESSTSTNALNSDTACDVYYTNHLGPVHSTHTQKHRTSVLIEGKPCEMEVDSGSEFSIVSEQTFHKLIKDGTMQCEPFESQLTDFQGNSVQVKGISRVHVQYGTFDGKLRLLVAQGHRTSLLGMEWFQPLGISLVGVHQVEELSVEDVLTKFSHVFGKELGKFNGPPVSLHLDSTVTPVRMRSRQVPFALKPKIDEEIDRLIEQGILEPITHPKWETPIVTAMKPNGEIRICGDYKCTINKALSHHPYPIPVVRDLLASLSGGNVFAKLDLAQAYQQLVVDEEAADAQTITTHRGAFRVKRLQFGVNVAPGIFQKFMDDLLKGIPRVVPYFDDVLIAAGSKVELAGRLHEVLQRIADAGLRLKRDKCRFGVTQVDFLGFVIDKDGVHPSKEKVKAIHEAPAPTNRQELQAFLGLLNFYHIFLKNKATVAEPLHRLLDKEALWEWTPLHAKAFEECKQLISSESVLHHYDESKPLVLTCDASPCGIGAVLSHRLENYQEVPIAFYSRTLSSAERNYAQIDKEALAIIASVKKFHYYVYGRSFEIVTDHKPLLGLFAPGKQTPQILSPRMLRWSVLLSAYNYDLVHQPGRNIRHADALSRLPLGVPEFVVPPPLEVLFLEGMPNPPLHAEDIAQMTARDPILSRVLNWALKGWPSGDTEPDFQTFKVRQHELTVHKGCILWGNRVVIPEKGRNAVLDALHTGHPGIVRMKALARSYVWWPKMDGNIEERVNMCVTCQESRPAPPRAPVHAWETTRSPWSRLHVDFAGPFQGQTFLIVVDSFSKWLEVVPVSSMTTRSVINALRQLFATHGMPDTIVSDNGAQFTSEEFRTFMKAGLIRHVTSAPFHPSSNGQAERMVRTTKDSLRRIIEGDWGQRLASFLLQQHVTPCTTTGRSPAELLMNRRLRTLLDRLNPDLTEQKKDSDDEINEKTHLKLRSFQPQDLVFVRNYGRGPNWIPATVIEATGPVSYRTRTQDGAVLRRHVDQMRRRGLLRETPEGTNQEDTARPVVPDHSEATDTSQAEQAASILPKHNQVMTRERPDRVRAPPQRWKDFV